MLIRIAGGRKIAPLAIPDSDEISFSEFPIVTERTLSRLIVASIVTATMAYAAIRTGFLDSVMPPGFMQIVFMSAFGAAPCFLILKAISRLFLLGLKGQPPSFIEPMFSIYYLFLTREARAEWRSYIEEQKNKGN